MAPLLRAGDADKAGRWLQPGVIVEVPPEGADEGGAWLDDSLDAAAEVANYYRRISEALMTQIEHGTAPWMQAWEPDKQSLPYNIKTGRTYRGGNMLWLQSEGTRRQYADERWGTYKQIKSIAGQVRRGESGCSIVFLQAETKKLARDKDGLPVY